MMQKNYKKPTIEINSEDKNKELAMTKNNS